MNYEIAGYEDKEVRKGDVWKDGKGRKHTITYVNTEWKEEGVNYCLTTRDVFKEQTWFKSFTIKGYLLRNIPNSKENLVTYVGNVNDSDVSEPLEVPYEDEHAQDMTEPEPEPEPEPIFSQDLSEPYDYETDKNGMVDPTIHLQAHQIISHNSEYYIKQAIHIYVDLDDLDRARILIKALKHIKEI